jgi:hypothetical protein
MLPRLSSLVLAAALGIAPVPQGASAPSLDRPCSFATADQVSSILGTKVAAATDEHFRCKYTVDTGWIETKLLDISLKMTRDIYEYDRAHGRPVPGVGDQAYVLGAALVAKVGDVVVSVDGSNLRRAPDTAKLKAIALTIVGQIP